MRMRRLVICPDAIGNRDFCRAGETCLMPSYDLEGFQAAFHEALSLPAETKQRMIENGFKETFKHDIAAERKAYVELISQVDEIWASF
jgi:trehalose-6-phosphate synthase